MFPRWVQERVRKQLSVFPAVFLQGARQVGKTTLARQLIAERVLQHYFTMDDPVVLASASQDPKGFVENLPLHTVLDEVQRVPELLPVLKIRIDTEQRPGMFLLTGSANPLTLSQVAESLVGRMAIVTLDPLSQGEIERRPEQWIRQMFSGGSPSPPSQQTDDLDARILRGGFPRVAELPDREARQEWFRAYLTTLLSRDLRDLANVERLVELPRLLNLLATLSARLLNVANLSRESGIPQTTLQRYLAHLETLFLITRVPAWYANLGKRLLKTPKLLLNDSGLCAFLMNADETRLQHDPLLRGQLYETFVGLELLRQIHHSVPEVHLYHYRTDKQEVDFVLENEQGQLVAVEVKASQTLGEADFRGLRGLHEAVGEHLVVGVVLYQGSQSLPFGERLWAQPISALWDGTPNEPTETL
ncbi:MAG: ATP-binding protein [Fimbriimonadales bacterium]